MEDYGVYMIRGMIDDEKNVPLFTMVLLKAALAESCVDRGAMRERKMARIGNGSALFSGLEGGTTAMSSTRTTAPLVNREHLGKRE